jgi:hypothetical protein
LAGAKARLGEPQNRVFPKDGRFSQRVFLGDQPDNANQLHAGLWAGIL